MKKIVLGGGCFWCIEAIYQRVKGVEQVVSGYAGGKSDHTPSYYDHGTHAEVIEVTYNENRVSLEQLLEIFFYVHDPTTLNRQGHDIGEAYRSIILYSNDEEHKLAERVIKQSQALWDDPIVTEVKKLDSFTPAEEYHQDFYNQNRSNPYCQVIINPKLAKFQQKFGNLMQES